MIRTSSRPIKERNVMQTLFLSHEQSKELIAATSPTAHIVFTYYIAIAHQPNPNMEDEFVASLLGLSERTVRRARTDLTKAGWFKRVQSKKDGETIITYLVGKEAVASSTAAVLQIALPKKVQAKRQKLLEHFKYSSWDELVANVPQDDIAKALFENLEGEAK